MEIDWLAVYGATIGTISAAWQIARGISDRRTALSLEASVTFFIVTLSDAESIVAMKDGRKVEVLPQWRIDIAVTNRGRSPAYVTGLHVEQDRSPSSLGMWTAVEKWELPWRLEPAERRSAFFTDDEAPDLEFTRADLTLNVTTSDDRTFMSEPFGSGAGALVALPGALMGSLIDKVGWNDRFFLAEMTQMSDGGTGR